MPGDFGALPQGATSGTVTTLRRDQGDPARPGYESRRWVRLVEHWQLRKYGDESRVVPSFSNVKRTLGLVLDDS